MRKATRGTSKVEVAAGKPMKGVSIQGEIDCNRSKMWNMRGQKA